MIPLPDPGFFQEASRSSRRGYLSKLVAELSPSDRRYLAAALGDVGSHMDILTALPLELSMRVLKYLTPIETIKLRLVSKRYHDLLTSEETCSFLSRQFVSPDYNSTKAFSSWRLHYENHVSRRLSFASGKPWVVEPIGPVRGTCFPVFCSETLRLVLPTGFESVSVQDLDSYPAKCVLPSTRTPDGSPIELAALLPSFVVVVTESGHGYAWNLETHREHRFDLPNSATSAMHGSGNLVAISSEGWVIIHDVQAEETRTFKDTRSDIREWKGEEFEVPYGMESSGILFNPEKQVVWMITRTYRDERWLLVIDSLQLETGRFAQRGVYEFQHHKPTPFYYSGEGLWQFMERCVFYSCLPKRYNTQKITERVVLDQDTGRLTVEYLPVEYHFHRSEPRHLTPHVWGPAISSDGLGCRIYGTSPGDGTHVWMLSREPGDEVAHAQLLDLRIPENPYGCAGFCDRLVLFYTLEKLYVARFRGIHDDGDDKTHRRQSQTHPHDR